MNLLLLGKPIFAESVTRFLACASPSYNLCWHAEHVPQHIVLYSVPLFSFCRYLGCSASDTVTVKKKETKISPVKKTNPPPTSHPVITVTEANPSTPTGGVKVLHPSIVLNVYFCVVVVADPIDSFQVHNFAGTDAERVSAPTSPLNRSNTDSNITYPYEDLPEASGASHFVNKDGGFDLHVILEVLKDLSHVKSQSSASNTTRVSISFLFFLLPPGDPFGDVTR